MMRILALLAALLAAASSHAADPWPEIKWETLVPKGWDPRGEFKDLNLGKLQDSDPRATEALDRLKTLWDNAPAEPSLSGRKIRIAGFALPLERKGPDGKGGVTEFLLVPYFGACIHTPPPANQIIHAKSPKPLAGVTIMVPIWAYGTLAVQRGETTWGVAGYRLTVDKVAPYETPRPKR
ncbi:MAG: DUF3299 domain-containing protein [Candidatus Nitricoxidivorans perseverans]|uniref:DUF3299 domain-containing protein n=1 Tax=Candidatus Nitricoxidivorans perseverans TaxID=2975601 RepID=A0AA49ITQ6_9PROT|nr:MAG: DUF3299 domain-containing protein [Candidatus Nitricoxidivorans perseverans]